MAGGIILSRRLERMQQAARDLGDTFEGIRTQQRKTKLEDEDRAIRNKAAATAQEAADLQLGDFKRRDAARQEAEGLAGQLMNFGQDVPQNEITAPADASLPGFGGMRSERPAVDAAGEAMKDRLRAAWMNADARAKGETSAFTAADVKRQREEAAAAKKRETEEYGLGIDKAKADIERTKAGTETEKMQQKKLKAELDQLAKGGMDPEKTIVAEGKLRDSYLGQNKGFTDVHDAYGRVMASVKDPSPAGDIALIFNYMKMLDPGSTVREGEFATAEEAGSIPTTVLNKYNKAVSGERLGETRADFIKQAGNLYQAAHKNYERNRKTFTDLAISYKLDPSRVAVPLETAGVAPGAGAGGGPKSFKSAREAMAAGLPPGTVVLINGVEAEM